MRISPIGTLSCGKQVKNLFNKNPKLFFMHIYDKKKTEMWEKPTKTNSLSTNPTKKRIHTKMRKTKKKK